MIACGKKESYVTIWDAAAQGDIEAIKQHLDAGADINGTFVASGVPGSGGTPLHLAALTGQERVIEFLLEEGADINARADDEHGGTPLHWAAAFGVKQSARLLVNAGAEVNAKDKDGYTPLDATFYQPEQEKQAKLEIANLLRENGGKNRRELE